MRLSVISTSRRKPENEECGGRMFIGAVDVNEQEGNLE